ncbi:MAG TPA: hypothetical protein VGR46_13500 [Candidatus Limnocylindria bacterium]|jgi:hypothetical protein|nr:hypothetical protein [Candidatus Limnocylindria bacterium]
MTAIRAFFIGVFAASVVLGACGGTGSGTTPTTAPSAAPALGTNKPLTSGDPYSDTGY